MDIVHTIGVMRRTRKQARQPQVTKDDHLEIRVASAEKQAFQEAAQISGLSLSAWLRERLRMVARKELEAYGRKVAFLPFV